MERSHKSFESIVNTHQNLVYNTVLAIVQNPEDAEEVSQDVFLNVYRSLESFREDSKLSTWIYRIAVNKGLDFLRRKPPPGTGFLGRVFGEREMAAPEKFYHPGVAVDRKEESAVLFGAINKLADQQKAAFVLQKVEGLSLKEIAEVLNTSVEAVEALLGRAKKKLQKLLENYYKTNYK